MKMTKKNLLLAAALLLTCGTSSAAWWQNGVLVSNVCRANANPNFYFVYPPAAAQPIGTPCTWIDPMGFIVYGTVYSN